MVTMNLPPLLANVDAEHLDIPLQTITSYCFFPIKWLRYVGWAIFHTEGSVSRQPQGAPLSDEAPLEDNDVLYFVVSGFEPSSTVDIEVCATRTHFRTNMQDHRVASFRTQITSRDGHCIFTSLRGEARHIIPFARGSTWLQIVFRARGVALNDINDIRNGFLCQADLHRLLDMSEIAVLVTPNQILRSEDVPQSNLPFDDFNTRPSPAETTYQLQQLKVSDPADSRFLLMLAANNKVASFLDCSEDTLPHPVLLEYMYGLAIITTFGSKRTWQNSVWKRPPRPSKQTTSAEHDSPLSPDTPRKSESSSSTFTNLPSTPCEDEQPDDLPDYVYQVMQIQLARQEEREQKEKSVDIKRWLEHCSAPSEMEEL